MISVLGAEKLSLGEIEAFSYGLGQCSVCWFNPFHMSEPVVVCIGENVLQRSIRVLKPEQKE